MDNNYSSIKVSSIFSNAVTQDCRFLRISGIVFNTACILLVVTLVQLTLVVIISKWT